MIYHHILYKYIDIPLNYKPKLLTLTIIPNFSSALLFYTDLTLRYNYFLINAPIQLGSPNLHNTFSIEHKCIILTPKYFIVSNIY